MLTSDFPLLPLLPEHTLIIHLQQGRLIGDLILTGINVKKKNVGCKGFT